MPIGYFHPGAALDLLAPGGAIRASVGRIFAQQRPAFLVVGSIEPRKNHGLVLDAFEVAWQQGHQAMLVIIGRSSWRTEAFLDRVAHHAELGRRLFVLRDATDGELDFAYRSASALVVASSAEGFGLPIVEAFQRGLPVICSDIPVFREVAGSGTEFFDPREPASLASIIVDFRRDRDAGGRGSRGSRPWLTWEESTRHLLAALLETLNLSHGTAAAAGRR